MHTNPTTKNRSGGYIALTAVLLVSTVFCFAAVYATAQNILRTDAFLAYTNWFTALHAARSCAEQAVHDLRSTLHYHGTSTIYDSVQCVVMEPEFTSDTTRTLTVSGTYHTTTIHLQVTIPDIQSTRDPLVWTLIGP